MVEVALYICRKVTNTHTYFWGGGLVNDALSTCTIQGVSEVMVKNLRMKTTY
jgi:hypothetical protein